MTDLTFDPAKQLIDLVAWNQNVTVALAADEGPAK
jgi:hypothetical protein